MKSLIVQSRPPRVSSVQELRWTIDDAVKNARMAGAEVFRSGRGFRLEFEASADADEFSERLTRGGFRFAEQD